KDLTALVAAVIEANLVKTLLSAGPFTVFAPTNAAFNKLPKGTVTTVLKPENLSTLQSLLKYHVIAGKFNAKDVIAAIKAGKGKAELKTVNGDILTASLKDNDVILTDANGGIAKVIIADVNQSNGVIHVINNVLNPKGWSI
ncbi:MAG TPA: fasciclin domain-containing protein, partial [Flavobacterium sp.]